MFSEVETWKKNEGIIAQICVNCKGGVYFWQLGWTDRNEALLQANIFLTQRYFVSQVGTCGC